LVYRHRHYDGYEGVMWDKNKVFPPPRSSCCGDLAGSIEKDGDSSDRRFHGGVDLVQSMFFTSLVLEVSDQFKGSTATISALGRWSLGARARRLPNCRCQADFGMGEATRSGGHSNR
jgi:hypothetical protein